MLTLLRRLRRDRRAAVAVITAVALPAMLIGTAMAVETAFVEVRQSQLQQVADAAAGAARQKLDEFSATPPEGQGPPVAEAQRIAVANQMPSAIDSITQGWWNVLDTKPGDDKFGGTVTGQTGDPFANAVRVVASDDHPIAFGALLGMKDIKLHAQATAYKCSNQNYPITRLNDDPKYMPAKPALWFSWATPGHDENTSYYYDNPVSKHRNPVFMFWSPTDGDDVSFVVITPSGNLLQVDTYCRGLYIVIPDSFDWKNLSDPITGTLYLGSTNNSFDLKPQPSEPPFAFPTTTYNVDPAHNVPIPAPYLDPAKTTHTTDFPNAYNIEAWASQGDPTPDRRTLLVR